MARAADWLSYLLTQAYPFPRLSASESALQARVRDLTRRLEEAETTKAKAAGAKEGAREEGTKVRGERGWGWEWE